MRPLSAILRETSRQAGAFTLVEVVMAMALATLVFAGILFGYTQAARRAEWSGYSLAAQGLAMQQIEQARSAIWDPAQTTNNVELNQITNIAGVTVFRLDLPTSGTNIIWATNTVTVAMKTNAANGSRYQVVKVNTVWPFFWGTKTYLFTNTVCTICAPDNRSDSTL